MLEKLVDKVLNTVHKYNMISNGDKVLVGFSGGADSLFLMEMLKELKQKIDFTLYAAHLNHGIRGKEAQRDADFVKSYCLKNKIDLFSKELSIPEIAKKMKVSEETAGRTERYKFFDELCKKHSINKIAVAHNMNDSVETTIYNMIRGSSLNGLIGIKAVNNNIIRPITEIKRSEIEKYLELKRLDFCIDSTNLTDIYTRNKIRNSILRVMADINESVIDTIYTNSNLLKDEDEFMNEYVQKLCCIHSNDDKIIILKEIFEKEKMAIKRRIVMKAFEMIKGDCRNITSKHIDILCTTRESGNVYNMPNGIYVYTSGTKLIFSKRELKNDTFCVNLVPGGKVKCYDGVYINTSYCNNYIQNDKDAIYIDADKLNKAMLTIRSRKDGDRFIPYGMTASKKLKKVFTDLKIPSFEKDKVPIICDGDVIAGIVPYRVSDIYKVTENTSKILKIHITKEE